MMHLIIITWLMLNVVDISNANWNEWWTYDGISGPAYWGLINPAWTMCNKVSATNKYY